MITATYNESGIVFSTDQRGWWNRYPRLALYIAANFDENNAVAMVPDVLMASDAEAAIAEQQLDLYDNRLISDMGYYGLVVASDPELGPEFMPHEITNRYY